MSITILVKECVLDDLVRAIYTVVNNQSYLSPKIASVVLEGIVENSPFEHHELLSPREKLA